MSQHRPSRPFPRASLRGAACRRLLALAPLAGLVLALPCAAESLGSSAASSASSAGSASMGSLSESLRSSSSSSAGEVRMTEGYYRVLALADVPGKPGQVELQLQAEAPDSGGAPTVADGPVWLRVPRAALAERALSAGDRVHARLRTYGVVFAHDGAAREPFFVALRDGFQRELGVRALPI